MGFVLGFGLLIGSIALILLICTVFYFYRKAKTTINRAKSTMNSLFGTDNLSEIIETRNEEIANTPKSVAGMTAVYAPAIQEDFPELNLAELKGMAEGHLKKFLSEKKNYASIRIHRTEIKDYTKQSGTCVVEFQSGVQYLTGTKKVQARYNTHMMYVQDADEYGHANGFATSCPHCGAAVSDLGRKFCDYCGSEVIPINIHVWELHDIKEA